MAATVWLPARPKRISRVTAYPWIPWVCHAESRVFRTFVASSPAARSTAWTGLGRVSSTKVRSVSSLGCSPSHVVHPHSTSSTCPLLAVALTRMPPCRPLPPTNRRRVGPAPRHRLPRRHALPRPGRAGPFRPPPRQRPNQGGPPLPGGPGKGRPLQPAGLRLVASLLDKGTAGAGRPPADGSGRPVGTLRSASWRSSRSSASSSAMRSSAMRVTPLMGGTGAIQGRKQTAL
jgi:hypothetical protein